MIREPDDPISGRDDVIASMLAALDGKAPATADPAVRICRETRHRLDVMLAALLWYERELDYGIGEVARTAILEVGNLDAPLTIVSP